MSSMELFRPSHPSLLGSPGFLRSVFVSSTKTAFSPCGFHWIPSLSYSRIHLRVRVPRWLSRSAVNSLRNGSSSLTCKGLCKVLWTIDVDMEDGQLLFLTGDPISLGCWEPDMAILLSPSKDGANLWKTEIKLPCGIHFKYNYFMKGETQSSYDVIWRQGPDFSLSVPCIGQEEEVIKVRDSWIKSGMNRLPSVSWGSWLVEIDLPEHPKKLPSLQAASAGAFEMLRCPNGAPSDSKKTLRMAKDDHHSLEKVTTINAGSLQMELTERDQPVEEPWLLRSMLLSIADSGKLDETSNEGRAPKARHPGELSQDAEKFMHKDECKPNTDPTSTVILINSSVCTMQRIAILEEGQLVELLLEPVKNNVQCDSVYLGIITQFVPHMGGAFVDIGISRPSLMDIKPNREPFAYPPFSDKINSKVVNNSLSANANKEIGINEHDDAYTEDEMIDDELSEDDNENDAIQPIDDVYMEQEAEDDIDIPDALNMNGDNDAIHSGEDEAEFEEYLMETGHHIEDESSEDFSSEMDRSMDSDLSNLIEESLMSNDDMHKDESKWAHVCEGTKVIVQVVKEGLGTKGPALTAYPSLRSRFWILLTRCDRIGVAKKITGAERTRLRVIAKKLQPPGFGLTVRTVAAGHTLEELQKDLEGLLATWKGIVEHAKSAALAAEEGVDGAVPIMLHRAMGQTLSVVQDYFNEKVKSMVVDSPRTYHEVTSYLQEIAPDLCYRVELYDKKTPIFDDYGIEEEINNILGKRVPLSNGGSLVIEQTEALVSIDVNGGHGMLGQETSQEKAVLEVNLAAAKQIARELRLRDIGGIIVVDFIDMVDESHKRLVYEEVKKAVERDRSTVRVSELSKHGLMEITRKRVRPSVTFMISEPCTCCHATGRVEALETSFSKIEHEICRLLAASNQKPDPGNAKSWPRFVLRVDRHMCTYLTTGKRTKLAVLSSSLKVWILLKVARGFSRGTFEVKPFTDGQDNDEQQVSISRLRPAEARALIPNSKLTLFSVKKWKSHGK